MKITYDSDADAMCIYLNEREMARTVRVSDRVFVHLNDEGNLRGVVKNWQAGGRGGKRLNHE